MVLPHTRGEAAARIAERVRLGVEAAAIPHAASPVCSRVTISMGVACLTPAPQSAADARPLIECADRYLYLAKKSGRNRVNYQDEEQAKP